MHHQADQPGILVPDRDLVHEREPGDIPIFGNSYFSPIPVLATIAQMQTDEGSYNL